MRPLDDLPTPNMRAQQARLEECSEFLIEVRNRKEFAHMACHGMVAAMSHGSAMSYDEQPCE
jgi:hypothetical protein